VRLARLDVGILVICAATIWPRITGGTLGIPGMVVVIVVTYAIGRLSRLRPRSIAMLVLALAAAQGCVAIAQSIPQLSPLIPFAPMRGGAEFHTMRVTGLFNNPNDLGSFLAAGTVLGLMIGARLPIWPLVAVCLTGIVLSSSREAALGLAAGLLILAACSWLRRGPRQSGRWSLVSVSSARRAIPPLITFASAVGMIVLLSPSTLYRFDPAGISVDFNVLDRIASWRAAVGLIRESPLVGYGVPLPVSVVDNVYLEILLAGGLAGLAIWLSGLLMLMRRELLPLLGLTLTVGMFANSLTGPSFYTLMIGTGIVAASARWSVRVPSQPPPAAGANAQADEMAQPPL